MNTEEKMTIEEIFLKLEEITSQLESGEVPLEDSFTLYEQGMKLLKDAAGRIDLVEKKMQIIGEGGLFPEDAPQEVP